LTGATTAAGTAAVVSVVGSVVMLNVAFII
jgi:hypothetical protein